jgi:hypothetical protein
MISGIYRHYLGKRFYVIGVARLTHSNTLQVVYRQLYESHLGKDKKTTEKITVPYGSIWVRPYDEFFGTVKDKGVKRFTPEILDK